MNRESFLARSLYRSIEKSVLPLSLRFGWTPDQFTWLGLFLSVVAGAFFTVSPFWGTTLFLLAGLCDVIDGFLARNQGKASEAGAFLDSVLDRYGELFILAGIWGYLFRNNIVPVPATIIVFAAMSGSLLVSYTRARGEGVGVSCTSGLFQRGERIVTIVLGGFLEPALPGKALLTAVAVVALGANITALSRLFKIRRTLLGKEKDHH